METWREIVKEMREQDVCYACKAFADRMEAECKKMEENGRIAIQSAQARHDEEVDALKCENAKLRRALEPVMKCDVPKSCICTCRDEEAVREAQEIMKGKKE